MFFCGQCQAPAALTLGKIPGTHCTGGWVGPTACLGRMRKVLPLPGFDPRTIQHVASRYTDNPHPSHTLLKQYLTYTDYTKCAKRTDRRL
jgi:hypothetical protein